MIEISLLGRVAVVVDGRLVEGEAAQRKRLAVLSLLALPPLRPISRERLMAYLWPERDAESARHLLSAAIHVLRRELGAGAIISTGDELCLDPVGIRVDVAEFAAAAEAEDWEGAIARYGGPFMDGFNPGGGPELDRWMDIQRERLERQHGEALRHAAGQREAAGDTAGAVELWRELAVVDPYSSEHALGLMRALAASGNRAAAIQHARIHAQLLGTEFEAEPDPDVEALAEALKESPEPVGQVEVAPIARVAAPRPAPGRGVTPDEPGPVPLRRRRYARWALTPVLLLAGASIVAAALAGVDLTFWQPADGPALPTLAVLPFSTAGDGEAERYLGDGIAEQVLDQLGPVPGIRVVSRASSFAYRRRDTDVREVGRALGATAVLEGSVARSDTMVRVWAQLVDAGTGLRLWSQTYDRAGGELFALQDEVSRSVARALQVQLRPGAEPGWPAREEAFDLYLRGRHAWARRTPAGLQQARDYFERAVALDSTYARAWSGLADAYNMLGSYHYGVLPPSEAYEKARIAARRALRLEPDLADAHAALATVQFNYDWDWAAAEQQFRQAIRLNPGNAQIRQWFALFLVATGRPDEAAAELRLAAELDPASPLMRTTRAHYFYYQREWARARREAAAALQLDSTFVRAHVLLALLDLQAAQPQRAVGRLERLTDSDPEPVLVGLLCHARAAAGQEDRARVDLQWLVAESEQQYVPHEAFVIASLGFDDRRRAIESLDRAFRERSGSVVYLPVEPLVDPLRDHPRFQQLLAERPQDPRSAP